MDDSIAQPLYNLLLLAGEENKEESLIIVLNIP